MRIIAHLDMDAFFTSVEERSKPWLSGSPVVVGADPAGGFGRGVVSTANYQARKYGIHSALPISEAWRLSEAARKRKELAVIFITPNFNKYSEASRKIMAIIRKYSGIVEEASIDEAYFDLSELKSFEEAKEICQKIKIEIKNKEKLTCSIGIGPNKLIAKIAAGMEKPDGLTLIREEAAADFLAPLPIRALPGIGPKTEAVLFKRGMQTVADIKKHSKEELEKILGKWGLALYQKARGLDETPLGGHEEAKSIGEQETFQSDTSDMDFIMEYLSKTAKKLVKSLKKQGFSSFKRVVLTVRFSDFETKTRSHTLKNKANDAAVLEKEGLRLMMAFFDRRENPLRKSIRLLGLRLEKLS